MPGSTVVAIPAQARLLPPIPASPRTPEPEPEESSEAAAAAHAAQTGELLDHTSSYYYAQRCAFVHICVYVQE